MRRWLPRAASAAPFLVPLALLAIAYRQAPRAGLIGDATFLIGENVYLRSWRYLPDVLIHDYFWASSGEAIGYWRPLTKASWLVETMLGGGTPAVYHLVQLAWFALAVVTVAATLRAAGVSVLVTTLAGCIVALHPAAIEPVSLVMARSDVVAFAGMLGAIFAFHRFVRDGGARWLALHVGSLVVALGSKEVAVTALVPIAILALLSPRRPTKRPRWADVVPAAALVLAYLAARRAVLGAGASFELALSPLHLVVGAGTYAGALFPFRLETGVRNLAEAELRDPATIGLAIVSLLVVGVLAVPAVRARRPLSLAALGWAAAAVGVTLVMREMRVPGAIGKLALADRWLLPGVGAAAIFLGVELEERRGPRWTYGFAAVVGIWALASLAVSSIQREPYRDGIAMLALEDRQLEATPVRFRTAEDRCRAWERALARATTANAAAAVAAVEGAASEGCTLGTEAEFNLLSVFVATRRNEDALRLLADLEHRPPRGRSAGPYHHLAGIVYLRAGDPERARPHIEAAIRHGVSDCSVHEALAATLPDPALASRSMEDAWTCKRAIGVDDVRLLDLAASLAESAGDTARATALRERAHEPPSAAPGR